MQSRDNLSIEYQSKIQESRVIDELYTPLNPDPTLLLNYFKVNKSTNKKTIQERYSNITQPKRSRKRVKKTQSKEGYPLVLVDSILKEREEMLGLHESKVLAIKKEYEAKLKDLNKKSLRKVGHALISKHKVAKYQRAIQKMSREKDLALQAIAKRKKELKELATQTVKQQYDLSKKTRESQQLQKKFDQLHNAHNSISEKIKLKKEEHERLSNDIISKTNDIKLLDSKSSKLKAQLNTYEAQTTHKIVREIGITIKRVNDHLNHADKNRASNDYNKIRELYNKLGPSEKRKVYPKIAKLARKLI